MTPERSARVLAVWLTALVMTGACNAVLAQESAASASAQVQELADGENAGADGSTVIYPYAFFEPYNPTSASDMLDRIPGVSISGRRGGGGRGLGTGGDLLIDGQRVAGKDNSPRDQLDRIAASEVQRIEIIRGTSAELDVRGADQVINVVLNEAASRSSTTVEAVGRYNHDGQYEAGGSVSHSRQMGHFQGLINLEARPNYENRISHETSYSASNQVLGTLRESNIRDQQPLQASANLGYQGGAHRLQFNMLYEDSGYTRTIERDFVDFTDTGEVPRREAESIDYIEDAWELGGEYEYDFGGGRRFQFLFIANDETDDNVRERFDVEPPQPGGDRDPVLFIDSDRRTRERIAQTNYSFPVSQAHSLRLGLERADTRLDSRLFIANTGGSEPASDRYGGLSPRPGLSNPGTTVEEMRYEGFVFHNWTLSERMSLENSLFYETSEISQSGAVDNSRRFNFLRPSVDFRYDITSSFQLRASVARNVSQLSFANFAATANNDDRERDANAGNPDLVPEKEIEYEIGAEYRLPGDNGVLDARVFYQDIEDYIGRINATRDPSQPLAADGNVGDAERWGMRSSVSTRLGYLGLPDAILTAGLNLFDSRIVDPFLDVERRIGGRGWASLGFRHDITDLRLSYGFNYGHPFNGGEYEPDITTITRNYRNQSLNLFVSRVMFNDVTFRLESDNTLDDHRCRERARFSPSIINGQLDEIERSCSSRGRRLTLRIQSTF